MDVSTGWKGVCPCEGPPELETGEIRKFPGKSHIGACPKIAWHAAYPVGLMK